ncbi:hypothetical protein AZI86_17090 [Bdellovibrio bacteriovorus]|uniref:OmpA-like domain-containing protein n=1 Tax=Bdellovibrio bacteriovorus TaxID=959 RepID=A0A150WEH0_BDEBC|nr:flagellar motor protein MotB [Bdellovibrio bacteriovorus]KYG61429.1 hypothetical protein AZI86_17090 [Bdellovibrio bacteriovorus]
MGALKIRPDEEPSIWDSGNEPPRRPPEHEEEGEGSWLVSYADMMTLLVGFFVVLQSFSKIDSSSFEKVKKETTQLFGGEYQMPFEDLKKQLEEVVKKMNAGDQVVFTQTEEGIEITFRGALFFETGSYELRSEAIRLLTDLIPVISEKAKDFGIVVEGHTDSRPLLTDGPVATNWELSSIRACRVLRLFLEKGFAASKIKALGWGDTRSIASDKNPDGSWNEFNQAQNRRVVVKILKNFEAK